MNAKLLVLLGGLFANTILAAESDDLMAAVKRLADKPSYAWKTVVVVPESAQFKPGPNEGKTEKSGYTYMTLKFADNTIEAAMKGDKAVVTNQEGAWQLASDMEKEEGMGRFLGAIIRNYKTPAAQAAVLAGALKDLKKDGDVYSGEMAGEGLKSQFRFGEPKNPKGTAKFWVKDGELVKFQTKVTAKLDFNGNEVDLDRETTTEIKEIGTAKVTVPEAAKKKLD
jgi:hypothetical protein